MIIKKHDVAIIGGGLAGVVAAIELAENNLDVAIIYDQKINHCASAYAQGGIAAIVSSDDSIEAHINDTYIASGKLAKLESITQVVTNSNAAIAWLEKHGVEFDKKKMVSIAYILKADTRKQGFCISKTILVEQLLQVYIKILIVLKISVLIQNIMS